MTQVLLLFALNNSIIPNIEQGNTQNPMAFGFGLSWFSRKDYGSSNYNRVYPEAFAYKYNNLISNFYMRWGLRVSYSNDDPEFPSGLKIKEKDINVILNPAILMDGYLIPTLGLITGLQYKQITLQTSSRIQSGNDSINNSEWINIYGLQLGLGVPINQGFIVIEPYIRATLQPRIYRFSSDNRGWFWFGIESSFQI